MTTKFRKALFVAALAMISFEGTQAAHALAHPGMTQFCRDYASQCRVDNTSHVTLTDELLAKLQQVNSQVNRAIRPVAERGGRDLWQLNPASGDCEDFALSKRAALIRAGVPAGALRIGMTKTRRGQPHAVLLVKTSEGDFVLDNLSARVTTLRGSGYRMQFVSTSNPKVFARNG